MCLALPLTTVYMRLNSTTQYSLDANISFHIRYVKHQKYDYIILLCLSQYLYVQKRPYLLICNTMQYTSVSC